MSERAGLFGIGQVPQSPNTTFSTFMQNFALATIWIGGTYIVIIANKLYDKYKAQKVIGSNTIKAETSLKLEAQKVTAFSGNFADWAQRKSQTQCSFDSSGYKKVLMDKEYTLQNTRLIRSSSLS